MRRAMWASLGIVLAMTTAASAVTITWNYDGTVAASNSWNTAASWDLLRVPIASDDMVLGTVITAPRTLTLDANWVINSLTCNGLFVYTLDRGTANRTLTINTGNISVNATGANLAPANAAYVTLSIPNSLSATWDIGGPTFVGNVNGASPATTITKTGSGRLTWGGSGNYTGLLTVNAGDLRWTGSSTGLGNFLMTPTGVGDLTLDGTGSMGLAASKTARFLGTASGNVIISPGTTAGATSRLIVGTAATNTVTLDNLSRYYADVSGTAAGVSDVLASGGAISLGNPGTTNALYITLPSGSLQTGFYVLAANPTSLTGTFNEVYYNGSLVANPTNAGAIGTTHRLVYGARSVVLESAGATDNVLFWVNPGAASPFITAGNWSAAPAYDSTDRTKSFIMSPTLGGTCTLPASGTYTIGQLCALGSSIMTNTAASTATFNVTNSGGRTGDVKLANTTNVSGSTMTWNVYGDWRIGGTNNWESGINELNLYGSGKFVEKGGNGNDGIAYGAATDGYVINTNIYGSYANDPGSTTDIRTWRFQNLKVKNTGTINGGFWVVKTLQVESGGQLIDNPSNRTDFVFMGRSNAGAASDNTNLTTGYGGGKLALPGGVNAVFPHNVELTTGYSFNSSPSSLPLYVWKMASSAQSINVGDLYVNGGLYIGSRLTGGTGPGINATYYVAAFNPVDNDATGTKRNAYISGNVLLGSGTNHRGILYIDDCNTTSVIDVGGTVDIGFMSNGTLGRTTTAHQPTGSVHLGGGTVQVGGDWRVWRDGTTGAARTTTSFLYTNWNEGTSKVIFDGNGTVKTQTIASDDMPFYTLIVHTPVGGTVARSTFTRDNLYIKGDLRLEQGIFNDRDFPITFNGPGHTLFWDNNLCKVTGDSLDNIILLPNAVLYLDAGTHTTIVMDNLDMQLGSKLYLNGFTLMAEGNTWISDQVSADGVAYTDFGSNGTIYGTMAIPEPATLLLLGTGALGVLGYIRRRRMT